MLTTTMPEMGAFYKALPAAPGKRPLFTCTDRHFAEVDAHRQLAQLLTAFEALYALKRQAFWAQQAPTKRRMVPVARATNPRPMIAVTVLAACPRGRSVRGEYQPRTERLPLYAYTCDAATPSGYEANPDSWRVESAFQGSTGYVGGLADALAGPEAELAGFAPELRAAKEAYIEASGLEFQQIRNRWSDEMSDKEDLEYAGFKDHDLTFALAQQDLAQMRLEYAACQRRLRRVRKDPERLDEVPRLRQQLCSLRAEKETLLARILETAKEIAA